MKRIFKDGIVTTCLGVAMMCGATFMFLNKGYTTQEAGELGAIGLIFLRSKDSLIGLKVG